MSTTTALLKVALPDTLRRDRVAQIGLGVFVAVTLLHLARLAGVTPEGDHGGISLPALLRTGYIPFLLPCLLLAAHLWRLGEVEAPHERRFWIALACGDGAWLLAEILGVTFPGGIGPLPPPAVRHASLALTYIILVFALDLQPHLWPDPVRSRADRFLIWPSKAFFVLGFLIYFLFIPLGQDPRADPGLVGAYFNTVLDGYLLMRLAVLARTVKSPRWRPFYLLLALAWLVMVTLDLGQIATRRLPAWDDSAPPGWGWLLVIVILVLAARLRHHPLLQEKTGAGVAPRTEELSLLLAAQTLALGLAFPLLHLVANRLAWLDPSSRPAREVLVLSSLVLFGGVALVQQRVFERRAQTLWIDRLKFENSLQASGKDLRLMVERHKAREVHVQADRKFHLTFRSCPSILAISRFDDGRFIEVNPAFESILGHTRDEALGRSARDLGLWIDPEDPRRLRRELADEGEVRELETELRTKSGETRHVLLSAAEIELGGQRFLLTIGLDITQRHARILNLERRTSLVDRAFDAVIGLDGDGRIRYWNRGAERLYGWSSEEVRGRPAAAYIDLRSVLPDILDSDDDWTGELEHVTKEGRRLQVDVWSTCVHHDAGSIAPRLVISSHRDREAT